MGPGRSDVAACKREPMRPLTGSIEEPGQSAIAAAAFPDRGIFSDHRVADNGGPFTPLHGRGDVCRVFPMH